MISVVIPSRSATNLAACAAAIHRHEPNARIICVWDLSKKNIPAPEIDCIPEIVEVMAKRFNFSRNCNFGIRHALVDPACEGVVIIGDDGILETPAGFSLLAFECRRQRAWGLIAATTNLVGNRNQMRRTVGLRLEPRMVCFVAVYIPRSTLETVGFMNEEFTAYSHQDDDYCLRVRRADLKIGIHDHCFVDHRTLPSVWRAPGGDGHDIQTGANIFRRIWGADSRAL